MTEDTADSSVLHLNGIDGDTGGYLHPRLDAEQLWRLATGKPIDPDHRDDLEWRRQRTGIDHLGMGDGQDPRNLAESGWGVIFPHDSDPAIREALAPLLDWRREQAGTLYQEFSGARGFRPNWTKNEFLKSQGAGPGPVNPRKVPYYLLIVADPETIPYRFQYQIDVQHAVGRIHFDSVDDYAQYARSVVEAERKGVSLARKASFWGTANRRDYSTELTARELLGPLVKWGAATQQAWAVESIGAREATKQRLAELLGGDATPAFLFTASHGMGFKDGSPRQFDHTGALVCQDWPGPDVSGPIAEDHYFAASDLGAGARLHGLIAMFFACYGAGCPRFGDFAAREGEDRRRQLAPRSFVSELPRRMLAHRNGGALAVIGHVDAAWGYSFSWPGAGSQCEVFQSALGRLLDGYPVGAALEFFNSRYAELSSDLAMELEDIQYGGKAPGSDLARLWTANNDARNYAIVGDPAVRLTSAPVAAARG